LVIDVGHLPYFFFLTGGTLPNLNIKLSLIDITWHHGSSFLRILVLAFVFHLVLNHLFDVLLVGGGFAHHFNSMLIFNLKLTWSTSIFFGVNSWWWNFTAGTDARSFLGCHDTLLWCWRRWNGMVLVKSVVAQDFDVVRRLFHCCDSIIWAF
jgi:hypothetical protein